MSITNKWILIYNIISGILWTSVLFTCSKYFINKEINIENFWINSKNLITITQSLAIFEIPLSIIGIVKSVVSTVIMQIFSRLFLVYLVFNYLPTNNKWIFSCLISWSIIEIIRYLFYSLNLLNIRLNCLTTLRNKLPLILYPIGITSEIICTIYSLENIYNTPTLRAFPYSMPNNLNFQIDIYYLCIFILFLYVPGSFILYSTAIKKSRQEIKPEEKKL